jgi:hypothetical protein
MRPTMPDYRDSQRLTPRQGQAQQTPPARVGGSPLRVYGGGRTSRSPA